MLSLGRRHFAGRIIRPVAIEADYTPFYTPPGADKSGVFPDPVIDPVATTIRYPYEPGTITSWDRLRYPRIEGRLTDVFEPNDA